MHQSNSTNDAFVLTFFNNILPLPSTYMTLQSYSITNVLAAAHSLILNHHRCPSGIALTDLTQSCCMNFYKFLEGVYLYRMINIYMIRCNSQHSYHMSIVLAGNKNIKQGLRYRVLYIFFSLNIHIN